MAKAWNPTGEPQLQKNAVDPRREAYLRRLHNQLQKINGKKSGKRRKRK